MRAIRIGIVALVGTVSIASCGAPPGVSRSPAPAVEVATMPSPHLAVVDHRAQLASLVQAGQAAPTVNVLQTAAPTTIVQFPLQPSGLKKTFPGATGLVTILRGDRDRSIADVVTVDVDGMPPDITFTIFLAEIADKPFGNVQYVADLTTREDGTGESTFSLISLLAFAVDNRDPSDTTADPLEGTTTGVNLGHLGMWFSSLDDAKKVLKDDTVQGTIFDGGNPPNHAGPQAMSDGQKEPVL
jgi:hypothetical protein